MRIHKGNAFLARELVEGKAALYGTRISFIEKVAVVVYRIIEAVIFANGAVSCLILLLALKRAENIGIISDIDISENIIITFNGAPESVVEAVISEKKLKNCSIQWAIN